MDGSVGQSDVSKTSDVSENSEQRFQFGRNWANFLSTLDEDRIAEAQQSVEHLIQVDTLRSKRFLDAGSGSGLFSLAASRLGAAVTSFDADAESVACTQELRDRYVKKNAQWIVLQGSLLDSEFLRSLGQFDVVYCWGVAHHTGDMWKVLEDLVASVSPDGLLVLAIYNDQQYVSRVWRMVKSIYQRLPRFLRPLYVIAIGGCSFAKRAVTTLLSCLFRIITFQNPLVPILNWIHDGPTRGMHSWYDLIDWVGGWPFEVARPEEIFRFMRDRNFVLQEMKTSNGHGCNEFVFLLKGQTSD